MEETFKDHLMAGLNNLRGMRTAGQARDFISGKMKDLGINERHFDVDKNDPLYLEFRKMPPDLAFTVFRSSFVRHVEITVLAKKMVELLGCGAIMPGDVEALKNKTAKIVHFDAESPKPDEELPSLLRMDSALQRSRMAMIEYYIASAHHCNEKGDQDGYDAALKSAQTYRSR